MELEQFLRLADRQFEFVNDLSDIDGYFLDVPQESWTRRATRADIKWVEYMHSIEGTLPSVVPSKYRRTPRRVYTAIKLFPFERPFVEYSHRALDECREHPELQPVAKLIVEFTDIHLRWLAWLRGDVDSSDAYYRWKDLRYELSRFLITIGLLAVDEKRTYWNQWRKLCTTKRQKLLDLMWLSNVPLLRKEILERLGESTEGESTLRREIEEINKLAAKQKPFIPWAIVSDKKTKKWSKKWIGG